MRLINVAALRLAHLDEVIDEKSAVVLADSPRLLEALVRIERQLFLGRFKVLRLLLQHIRKRTLLTQQQFVVHLLDVADAALAQVAPLGEVLAAIQLLFLVTQALLLLLVRVLNVVTRLQ